MNARKKNLRAGGPDVDADAAKNYVVTLPQRMVFNRPFVLGISMMAVRRVIRIWMIVRVVQLRAPVGSDSNLHAGALFRKND